ncbi:hypothetical protein J5690_05450, partial [bacterium]|nr:hypothetical protein [bacterium]
FIFRSLRNQILCNNQAYIIPDIQKLTRGKMMSFNKKDSGLKKLPNLIIFAVKKKIAIIVCFCFFNNHFGGKNEQQNPGSS